jgi:hypothetical protein
VAVIAAVTLAGMARAEIGVADQIASGLMKCDPSKPARSSHLPQVRLHPQAAAGLRRLYRGTPISVTTFHYDGDRTGWDPNETDLTPTTVASSRFGLLKQIPIAGTAKGQPLLVVGYTMSDGAVHDVLVIATTANMVYAFDARSYATLWSVGLGPPITDPPQDCPRREPLGVSSTPVIGPGASPGARVLYVAGNVQPNAGTYQLQVRALDVGSGRDVRPAMYLKATETLPNGLVATFDPLVQYDRAGLALNKGRLYIPISIAAACEKAYSTTVGWLFEVPTDFSSETTFSTIAQQTTDILLNDIWMTGYAPAIGSGGELYVTTGNGDANLRAPRDWGSSVIKLTSDLSGVADSFTPADYASIARADGDFSSGGIMLLPRTPGQISPPLAVAMGKEPIIYLLDQTALGGYSRHNRGALQVLKVGQTDRAGVWGGPAYYDGPSGPTIYYQTADDVLKAYRVSTGAAPSLTLAAKGASTSSNGGSIPIVSSEGAAANTGVVWLVRRTAPPALEAYDATRLGAPIYQASVGTDFGIYHTPMVANGRVYVGTAGSLYVFGLTGD